MNVFYIFLILTFIIAIIFFRLFLRYKKEIRASLIALQGESELIQTKSGQIEYKIVGEGYPVLISHGGAGGFDQGMITATFHLYSKYKIISVSRFGHLRTPITKASSATTQAEAYSHLLEELNIPCAAIIGTSGGAPSAIQFAQNYPQKCSALVITCGVSEYLPKRPLSIYKNDLIYWIVTTYFKSLALEKIGVTKELQKGLSDYEKQYLEKLFKSMHPISLRKDGLFQDVYEWADVDRWKNNYHYENITVPTLVIHAIDDTNVPYEHAENVANKIPRAVLLSLPSGGHAKLKHFDLIKERVANHIDVHVSPINAT